MKEEKKRRRKGRGGGVTEAHHVPTTGHAYVNRNAEENKRRLHTLNLPHLQGRIGTNMRADHLFMTWDKLKMKSQHQKT